MRFSSIWWTMCYTVIKVWTKPRANTEENVKQNKHLPGSTGEEVQKRRLWWLAWTFAGEEELSRGKQWRQSFPGTGAQEPRPRARNRVGCGGSVAGLTPSVLRWFSILKQGTRRSTVRGGGLSLVLAGEQPQRKKAREMDEWFACCFHLTCCGMWLITYLHGQLLEWTKETQPVEIPGKLSWGPNRKCQSRDFTGAKLKYQCWELCFSKNHSCSSTLGETLWQMYMDNNQGPIDTILSNTYI